MQQPACAYVSLVLQPRGMSQSRTVGGIFPSHFFLSFARIFRIIALPHISRPKNLVAPALARQDLEPIRVRSFVGSSSWHARTSFENKARYRAQGQGAHRRCGKVIVGRGHKTQCCDPRALKIYINGSAIDELRGRGGFNAIVEYPDDW